MLRVTDHPDMTSAVYHGLKALNRTINQNLLATKQYILSIDKVSRRFAIELS